MSSNPSKTDRRRRALALPVAVAAVAASGLVTLTSGALFTSADTVDANTFTSGTVILDAVKTVDFVAPNMAPGDTVSGQIDVQNTGSLAERYAITSSTVGDAALADALVVSAKVGTTAIYDGPLSGFAVGDPTQGEQTGDRALAASTNEVIDFTVTLPIDAPNSLQGLTTTATFDFSSEQTKNN